jgi:hypothetical protein
LPVGSLPKERKEIAKRSSSTMSAYTTPMMEIKKSAKGGVVTCSSTANTTPTTLKMVGKNSNNNYLDEEEEYGKLEYAPSNVTFVPKAKVGMGTKFYGKFTGLKNYKRIFFLLSFYFIVIVMGSIN